MRCVSAFSGEPQTAKLKPPDRSCTPSGNGRPGAALSPLSCQGGDAG
jgi:hypothetical protein